MCDGRSVKNSIDSDTEYAHTSMTIRTFDIDSLSNCYLAPLLENEITLRRVSLSPSSQPPLPYCSLYLTLECLACV